MKSYVFTAVVLLGLVCFSFFWTPGAIGEVQEGSASKGSVEQRKAAEDPKLRREKIEKMRLQMAERAKAAKANVETRKAREKEKAQKQKNEREGSTEGGDVQLLDSKKQPKVSEDPKLRREKIEKMRLQMAERAKKARENVEIRKARESQKRPSETENSAPLPVQR